MRTRVSTKGQIVLPATVRRKLDIRAGDSLDIAVEENRIVLSHHDKPKYEGRIIEDPLTGFTVLDLGPDAPILTSEMVKEIIKDFP
jgi:AbrB family looped-hinge helix DNA binding protein